MRFGFLNNFSDQVAAPVSDTATSIELAGKASDIQAALQSADAVALTLFATDGQGNETQREVVYATAAAPPLVTVTRAQEGTTAVAFAPGDSCEGRLTAGALDVIADLANGAVKQSVADGANTSENTIALVDGYTLDGNAYPKSEAPYVGAVAIGAGAGAYDTNAMAIGARHFDASATQTSGPVASAINAIAIGAGAGAYGAMSVSIGVGAETYASGSVALGDAYCDAAGAFAAGGGANAGGVNSVALGGGTASGENSFSAGISSNATSTNGLALMGGYCDGENAFACGESAYAGGLGSIAIGASANAVPDGNIAIGSGAAADVFESTAVGQNANSAAPMTTTFGYSATAAAPEAVALGPESTCNYPYGVALGRSAKVGVTGGLNISALSYITATYDQTGVSAGPPPNATRQNAMQIVVASTAIDLTDAAATEAINLPTNTFMFVDGIDVVVVEANGAGGAPEIQIGPDGATPASYLAATPITKTTAGGRDTFTPLVTDGVTDLRVSVATAGTGTSYKVKVVARGYVMEV